MAYSATAPQGVSQADYLNYLTQLQQANAMAESQSGAKQQYYDNQQAKQSANLQWALANLQNNFTLQQQAAGYQAQQQQGQAAAAQQAQQFQLLTQLLKSQSASSQEARDANEKRRNEILAGRTGTRNRILDQWNNYGDSLVNDTNRGYQRNLDNSLAALSHSGLLQSTVNSSIRSQNERDRQDSMRRVKDDIISNYANTDERLSNNIDDFQERITDSYPENSMVNTLASQLGNIMPQQGGGYGYGTPNPMVPYIPSGNSQFPQQLNTSPTGYNPAGSWSNGFAGGTGSFGNRPQVGGGTMVAYGGSGYGAKGMGPGASLARPGITSSQIVPTLAGSGSAPNNGGFFPANHVGAMQEQTRQQQAAWQPLPWQANQAHGDINSQFVGAPGGGYRRAYEQMPALGIFGAGVQMGNSGGGSSYGGSAASGGGYQARTPLWQRDPVFMQRLAGMGLDPSNPSARTGGNQFQISGGATSVSQPNRQGGSNSSAIAYLQNLLPYLTGPGSLS